jgi:hypothetical protein
MISRMTRRRFLTGAALGMGAVGMSACGRKLPASEPGPVTPEQGASLREIGSRWELFVDDWLIARLDGAELRLHPPIKREIVLVADQPWEGKWSAYFTALQDGPTVRLYYRGFTPADVSEETCTCMVESCDGIHFERPKLGLYEFNGSKQNNIVHRGIESHNLAPFIDHNPQARPEERYKALGGLQSKLYALSSADGLRWRKMQADPVMTKGAFDSLNVGFWDPVAQVYRSYTRYWTGGEYKGYRGIQSSTSADFLHWSDPEPNRYQPEVSREHLYTNATIPCPDAPHILLAFPKRFVPERTKLPDYKEPGVSDAMFMTSRDGVNWSRIFREAWVRPDLDERNWTHRSNMPAWGIVQTSPDEFTMYISEHYDWPDNRLRRLTIRRHGFASIHAGAGGGTCLTQPLRFEGTELVLNYATSAAGVVSIEVQDADGKALMQSNDMFGNELEGVVPWLGGARIGDLAGKPVRLLLTLRDADVYALRFRP